jgi:hypothetical protein
LESEMQTLHVREETFIYPSVKYFLGWC